MAPNKVAHTATRRKTKPVILPPWRSHLLCMIVAGLLVEMGETVAPSIDYSHNMRILKLPQSTPIGSLVYRLKGSDGDPNSQLMFGVGGHEARTLLDVVSVPRSWNEADVYLRSKPEKTHYNFTLFVTDGNKTTQVESTILITGDEQQQQQQQILPANSTETGSLMPFLNTKHVFHVPENAKPNELIGSISVLESEKSDLPVRFELRGKGSEKFSINYVFGPKGQSRGELVLGQEVDYERQNLFSLKVLALNAWTDVRFDTRNVASMDIVITIGDVQDSPPVFRNLPQFIRLPTDLVAGQTIYRCEAEDGDFADQRPVQFALDAGSPLANYFDIDKSGGQIRLTKSIAELQVNAAWQQQQQSSSMLLTVFASELPDPSSYDHLWPPMYARAEIPLLLVDTQNEAPQFVGGWQTRERAQVNTLHGYLPEWTAGGGDRLLAVRWFTNGSSGEPDQPASLDGVSKALGNRPMVIDLGLGSNGTFELALEGADAELFHLEPSGFPISRQTTFTLSVAEHANKSLFDHEHNNKLSHLFTVDVVARDFGQPQRLASKIRCLIELVDANDNWPQFETDLYSFSVYENAPIGYILGQVRARDSDSSGKVGYSQLLGLDSHLFRLNRDSGQVTLEAHLDREHRSFYMFLVEARDLTSDHGLANYTQLIVNVLDVNDNAPTFLQSHYDAVLMPDGTFYQPLQVKAVDADEPGTANSQVAYEIIAGNVNEQFSIDSVSGVIYPVASGGAGKQPQYHPGPLAQGQPELPSTLKEPIVPHQRGPPSSGLDQAGRIRPTHEVEESPRASKRLQVSPAGDRHQFDRQQQLPRPPDGRQPEIPLAPDMPEQLPALDMLMSLESAASSPEVSATTRGGTNLAAAANQLVGPVTTLIVRAHDFGIPLRSSTVKVNIFNQALLSRSVSLILNGTIEQLDNKREAIERAFGSLTGSRASIESLDALSDSSSLSVARVRLVVPEHSLVDLTDLSALMNAIEYRQEPASTPLHYVPPSSLNLSVPSSGPQMGAAGSTHLGHNIFSDIHSYAIDSNAALERRLLIYIIIVGVCILALLFAWMIYYCCSRNDHNRSQKLISSSSSQLLPAATYRPGETAEQAAAAEANKTHAKMAATSSPVALYRDHHGVGSPIGNNLAKGRAQQPQQQQQRLDQSMSNLLTPMAASNHNGPDAGTGGRLLKPNNYSMYNGQVWFEPNSSAANSLSFRHDQSIASGVTGDFNLERRASSAPSGGAKPLHLALHSALQPAPALQPGAGGATWTGGARKATGQFFPNPLGYARNVASMTGDQPDAYSRTSGGQPRRHGRNRRVAPMQDQSQQTNGGAQPNTRRPKNGKNLMGGHSNDAFVDDQPAVDLEAGTATGRGRDERRARKQSSLDSTGSTGSTGTGDGGGGNNDCSSDGLSMEAPASSSVPTAEMSVELDSDQELLGFDSSGTPIIATHTRATSIKPIVVERRAGPASSSLQPREKSHQVESPAPPADHVQTPPGGAVAAAAELQAADLGRPEEASPGEESERPVELAGQQDRKQKGDDRCSMDGDNKPPARSAQAASPLMSELTQRISSRKGSAESGDAKPESGVASALGEPATAAAALASSTSASNKRQLMLRQAKTTTTTKSLSRTQEQAATAGETQAKTEAHMEAKTKTQAQAQAQTRTQTQTSESADEASSADTISVSSRARELASMKNGELLEKKSIFALTYSGLATDKLPD